MSRTAIIGILAALLVMVCAFFPWSAIESRQLVFTGLNTTGSSYGEPGRLNIILSIMAIILFLIRNKWIGRINLFVSGFLLAWTFRNMVLFARCEMGECPQTGIALYLSLAGALVAFGCVLFTRTTK
ncbi:hypothetical protein [Chitinophaga nivalis]|uniref:Uncharacterized protein n=1 Tax=Chitinophaga nivalis TaxID=2991709 RepID=A0ABT3IKT9_9BACT|nr:hypothetical protein [Chitinophaga nivalis]MCW3465730.1 hypothetical protein [Chitinophaga nivalis]MCW3484579.1 hypothetical protein [Chitinophaga nivalis]